MPERRRLSLRPDPIALARGLRHAGLDHVALLQGRRRSWLTAAPDQASDRLDPLADEPFVDDPAPRYIGVIPYEARRELERPGWTPAEKRPVPAFSVVRWLRYPSVVELTGGAVILHSRDARHAGWLEKALARAPGPPEPTSLEVKDADPPEAHLARIVRARELIAAGDLYQVNLARRLDVRLSGDPLAFYARLHGQAPSEFAAAISTPEGWALSTSPELLLRIEVGKGGVPEDLYTEPIKGTRPRGRDPIEDARLARELEADPKEQAELAMIVDVERNDLGSVSREVHLVRTPAVTTHPTVHHRSALLRGLPRRNVTRAEILAAMVPSGSVTGAPKVRAMEVIADLEAHRRGLYTGGFGYVAGNGRVLLAIAIRTLTLSGDSGAWFTGGGIVIDSDPARELEETRWKALQLTRIATGPPLV